MDLIGYGDVLALSVTPCWPFEPFERRENARQCSYLGGDTVRSTWCICSAFASLLRAARRRSISASPVLRPRLTRTAPQIDARTVGGGHGRPKPVRHQSGAPRSDRARLAANRHGTSALPRQLRPFSMPTMPPPAPRDARADQTLVAVEPEGELIKTGTKVISHGRSVAFQMAEVAITRQMFQEILRLIAELLPKPPPAPA